MAAGGFPSFFGDDIQTPTIIFATVLSFCMILGHLISSWVKWGEELEEYEVSALFVYPIKSCKGIAVSSHEVYQRGFKADRQWLIVEEESGNFLTQRTNPKMALIEPSLPTDSSTELVLKAEGMPDLAVPIIKRDRRAEMDVFVWQCRIIGVDQGDKAAEWVTKFLDSEEPLRLVRFHEDFVRPTNPAFAKGYQTGFSDGYPFLLASEGSLEAVAEKLQEHIDMIQFRPNIVVKGCTPFAEDSWSKIKVGDLAMKIVKPCDRCKVPNINPLTGTLGELKVTEALQTFRTGKQLDLKETSWNSAVFFGQNVVHENVSGKISVGDKVKIYKKAK